MNYTFDSITETNGIMWVTCGKCGGRFLTHVAYLAHIPFCLGK